MTETALLNTTSYGLTGVTNMAAQTSNVMPIFICSIIFFIATAIYAYINPKFHKWLLNFLSDWYHYGKNGVYCCVALGFVAFAMWILITIFTNTEVQENYIKPLMLLFFIAISIFAVFGIIGRIFALAGIEADKRKMRA